MSGATETATTNATRTGNRATTMTMGLEPYEAEQLALDDEDDERLPWLESGEDEYYDEAPDMGRILGMFLLGVGRFGGDRRRHLVVNPPHAQHDPRRRRRHDQGACPAIQASAGQGWRQDLRRHRRHCFRGIRGQEPRSAARRGGGTPGRRTRSPAQCRSVAQAADTAPRDDIGGIGHGEARRHASGTGGCGRHARPGRRPVDRALAEAAWSRLTGQYSALSGQRHQIVEGRGRYRHGVPPAGVAGLPPAPPVRCAAG